MVLVGLDRQPPADDLVEAPAEERLGRAVPAADASVGVELDAPSGEASMSASRRSMLPTRFAFSSITRPAATNNVPAATASAPESRPAPAGELDEPVHETMNATWLTTLCGRRKYAA